jgi:Ca2+-binding EF-hand superfamily protein
LYTATAWRLFNAIDTSGDLEVDKDELRRACRRRMSDADATKLFDALDANGDGVINFVGLYKLNPVDP